MNRPYYVHTPRNIYGEDLARNDNGVCYEIRSIYTGRQPHANISDRKEADVEAKRLNDEHETEMACAMHI